MGELDDLEEIKIECSHNGSAKRVLAGKAFIKRLSKVRPLWKRELKGYRRHKKSPVTITKAEQ